MEIRITRKEKRILNLMIIDPFKGTSRPTPLIKSPEPIPIKSLPLSTAFTFLIVGLLMQSVVFSGRALAESVETDPWEFIVTPYLWGTYIDGSSTAGGETSSVDVNASDILRGLNYAFMGQITVRKGRWGGFINAVHANLDGSETVGLSKVSAEIKETLLDFGIFYRVGDWQHVNDPGLMPQSGFLDLYVGARYMKLGVDIDLQLPPRNLDGSVVPGRTLSGDGSKNWIDPIFGFRTRWNLTDQWNVALQADVGGGASADLTWQAQFVAGYRFGLFGENDANWLLGYRAIYEKYEEGQGDNKFAFNATTHGPVFGLAMSF